MSGPTDHDRFFKEAETCFFGQSAARGLNLAMGRWPQPGLGELRVIAIYGRVGLSDVALAFCATDGMLAAGEAWLRRYACAANDPFELKRVARPPLAERRVAADDDLVAVVESMLDAIGGRDPDEGVPHVG